MIGSQSAKSNNWLLCAMMLTSQGQGIQIGPLAAVGRFEWLAVLEKGANAACAAYSESSIESGCERTTPRLFQRLPSTSGIGVPMAAAPVADRVAIGMQRLAIIDPAGGMQPLWNERRTVALVANGEIYNFVELRGELKQRGHDFSTLATAK